MKKIKLVVAPDGRLFIHADHSGIMALLVATELPVSFFGKSKTPYVELKEVVAWHERELPHTKGLEKGQERHALRAALIEKFKKMLTDHEANPMAVEQRS